MAANVGSLISIGTDAAGSPQVVPVVIVQINMETCE